MCMPMKKFVSEKFANFSYDYFRLFRPKATGATLNQFYTFYDTNEIAPIKYS